MVNCQIVLDRFSVQWYPGYGARLVCELLKYQTSICSIQWHLFFSAHYIFYINDLCDVSKILDFILFADDTHIFFSHNEVEFHERIFKIWQQVSNKSFKIQIWSIPHENSKKDHFWNKLLWHFKCIAKMHQDWSFKNHQDMSANPPFDTEGGTQSKRQLASSVR